MTHIVDRNLAIGFAVALTLAALVAVGIRGLELPVLQVHRAAPPEPRARAAWAEPRDIDWRPKAAAKAPESVAASPEPAAVRPAKANGRAVTPSPGTGAPVSEAPGGEVVVAAVAQSDGAAGPGDGVGPSGSTSAEAAGNRSGGSGEALYGPGDVDVPPQPLAVTQPPFPPAAEKLGLTAQVQLTFVIEADGRVSRIDVHCGGCDSSFLRATRETVRSWQFAPARLHGQPVRVRVEQRIHFDLDE